MTTPPKKLPAEWREHFTQMPLIAEESPKPPKPLARPRGRPPGGAMDKEILSWIGYYQYATTAQIIERFWVGKGKGSRYGHAVLSRLRKASLIYLTPLEKRRGGASIRLAQLTKSGWQSINQKAPKDISRSPLEDKLHFRLQFTEMMLIREPEGWELLDKKELGQAIKTQTLNAYRGRVLTTTDQAIRNAIQANPAPTMPFHGLRNPKTGEIRILLPIRRGLSAKRIVDRMPPNLSNYTKTIHFEIIAAGHDKMATGRKLADHLARERKVQVHTYSVPHFALRQSSPTQVKSKAGRPKRPKARRENEDNSTSNDYRATREALFPGTEHEL